MYVCGPTVYDRPHLGNARSVVIYDVLYRLLKSQYPKVTYVRNITDVDDKINKAAKENGETIRTLTERVTSWFHDDMAALNVLPPIDTGDFKMLEPRATENIPAMIEMINKLIDQGYAYVADGHVLFDVTKYEKYGQLSHRSLEEMIAGNRIEVAPYKKNPGDFVLWKPSKVEDDESSKFQNRRFNYPGRPGWHIECSAMSTGILGENFDIHGGGADLMFPHHENEIAQSCCANPGSTYAKFWVHNGFLTVNGEKMSKSLGNFITVRDLLDKGVKGEVIRLALLMSKYNEPLDWQENLIHSAKTLLDAAYRALARIDGISTTDTIGETQVAKLHPTEAVLNCLFADLNTPFAISIISSYTAMINGWLDIGESNYAAVKIIASRFRDSMQLLGILQENPQHWFKGNDIGDTTQPIEELINKRIAAKKAKNFAEADRIRDELAKQGIILEDRPDGTTDWRRT